MLTMMILMMLMVMMMMIRRLTIDIYFQRSGEEAEEALGGLLRQVETP